MVPKLTAYDSLLLKYKPRPIRNDREHRRVLKHVEELIGQHGPTPPRAEGELIAVLSTLIESYEVETIPRRKPTPAETLEHLIEANEVTRAEVARATGIPGRQSPTYSPDAARSAKKTSTDSPRIFASIPACFFRKADLR